MFYLLLAYIKKFSYLCSIKFDTKSTLLGTGVVTRTAKSKGYAGNVEVSNP